MSNEEVAIVILFIFCFLLILVTVYICCDYFTLKCKYDKKEKEYNSLSQEFFEYRLRIKYEYKTIALERYYENKKTTKK